MDPSLSTDPGDSHTYSPKAYTQLNNTPPTATITGLLEVCHANGLPTHGWKYGSEEKSWYRSELDTGINVDGSRDFGRAMYVPIYPANATPTDLAAVCFEVTKWLRDEHKTIVYPTEKRGWWSSTDQAPGAGSKPVHKRINADNEPDALLAACKEVGK